MDRCPALIRDVEFRNAKSTYLHFKKNITNSSSEDEQALADLLSDEIQNFPAEAIILSTDGGRPDRATKKDDFGNDIKDDESNDEIPERIGAYRLQVQAEVYFGGAIDRIKHSTPFNTEGVGISRGLQVIRRSLRKPSSGNSAEEDHSINDTIPPTPSEDMNDSLRELIVLIDCDSLIEALDNSNSVEPLAIEARLLMNEIMKLCPNIKIRVLWVPSHRGIIPNVEVDAAVDILHDLHSNNNLEEGVLEEFQFEEIEKGISLRRFKKVCWGEEAGNPIENHRIITDEIKGSIIRQPNTDIALVEVDKTTGVPKRRKITMDKTGKIIQIINNNSKYSNEIKFGKLNIFTADTITFFGDNQITSAPGGIRSGKLTIIRGPGNPSGLGRGEWLKTTTGSDSVANIGRNNKYPFRQFFTGLTPPQQYCLLQALTLADLNDKKLLKIEIIDNPNPNNRGGFGKIAMWKCACCEERMNVHNGKTETFPADIDKASEESKNKQHPQTDIIRHILFHCPRIENRPQSYRAAYEDPDKFNNNAKALIVKNNKEDAVRILLKAKRMWSEAEKDISIKGPKPNKTKPAEVKDEEMQKRVKEGCRSINGEAVKLAMWE